MAKSCEYHLLQFLSIFMARVFFMVPIGWVPLGFPKIKIEFGQKKKVFGLLKKRR